MSFVDDKMLNRFLAKYQNPDATKRELLQVVQHYKGLEIKQEPYVFTDGTRMELVNLQGTIPVPYKGTFYNIPVCIWLMDTHPNNAPICYVKPTANMKIVVSMHVDHNGKIYLPYLHDWSPQSELMCLIQVMICKFSDQPPLFSTRAEQSTPSTTTPYPVQPYMPWPGSGGSSSTPYPPYPTQSTPYPPQPSQGYPPYPNYQQPYASPPVYPQASTGYTGYPPYPTASTQSSTSSTGTITEEHIRASLLSAVEDKLRRRLKEQYSQTYAELETLRRTQEELTQGKNRLDHLISKLESEQQQLEKDISVLRDKEQELDSSLSRLSEQGSIDVDEAVTTTAPLYKQLLSAFAEEAATEDVIYYLGEALRRGVIDLDVFLKHVRSLSHKQFMLRALMQKCRSKAGLAG